MAGSITGTVDFADLSARLKEAGETGLRRQLYKRINEAAEDLSDELQDPEHLYPYMPNHYADTLAADLKVRILKRSGRDPHLTLTAEGRAHKRKVIQLNDRGVLVHPVFGRGGSGDKNPFRKDWVWREQFRSVRQGWFSDPVERAAPPIRAKIQQAMRETRDKITARG